LDAVNQITAECFNAIAQLRELEGAGRGPEQVQRRLREYVDAMRGRAREQGISDRDANDMAYAIVALMDEVALSRPDPIRSHWENQSLQYQCFGESRSGEGFFNRLDEIRKNGRRQETLRVYYQCLLLGFQGKYSIRGGDLELMKIIESIRPEIEKQMEPADTLSPAGEPPDEPLVRSSQRNPFLWIALGVCAIAIAVFIGLKVSLNRSVSALNDRVEEQNR
jgi:type VI secretion system protein ImpK